MRGIQQRLLSVARAPVAWRRSMWQPSGYLSTALSASRLRMLAASDLMVASARSVGKCQFSFASRNCQGLYPTPMQVVLDGRERDWSGWCPRSA